MCCHAHMLALRCPQPPPYITRWVDLFCGMYDVYYWAIWCVNFGWGEKCSTRSLSVRFCGALKLTKQAAQRWQKKFARYELSTVYMNVVYPQANISQHIQLTTSSDTKSECGVDCCFPTLILNIIHICNTHSTSILIAGYWILKCLTTSPCIYKPYRLYVVHTARIYVIICASICKLFITITFTQTHTYG